MLFMLLSLCIGYLQGRRQTMPITDELPYKITTQHLQIQSVLWKDYPAYRELTLMVNGDISFCTKKDATVTFEASANPNAMVETGRKRKLYRTKGSIQACDIVTYQIHNEAIRATIPKIKKDNPISSILENSYYLTFQETDIIYPAGHISALDTEYIAWSAQESQYASVNLEAYLSAFSLSDTYDQTEPLRERPSTQGIILEKEEGSFLNCTLRNDTAQDWNYDQSLPHIELWYQGIWIELNAPFDNNLTIGTLQPSETKQYEIPQETLKQYPTLFQGIYRLVIYGEQGEFAKSEPFFYDGFQ